MHPVSTATPRSVLPNYEPLTVSTQFSGFTIRTGPAETLATFHATESPGTELTRDALDTLVLHHGSIGEDTDVVWEVADPQTGSTRRIALGKSPVLESVITLAKASEPLPKLLQTLIQTLKPGKLDLPLGNIEVAPGLTAEQVLPRLLSIALPLYAQPEHGEFKEFYGPKDSWRASYILRRQLRKKRETTVSKSSPAPKSPQRTRLQKLIGWFTPSL